MVAPGRGCSPKRELDSCPEVSIEGAVLDGFADADGGEGGAKLVQVGLQHILSVALNESGEDGFIRLSGIDPFSGQL